MLWNHRGRVPGGSKENNMRFVEKCKKLIDRHQNDRLKQKNGTLLLCPEKIPMARHYFFEGLQEHYIKL